MCWTILILCLLSTVWGNKTDLRKSFFYGHVFENSPPGSSVNGLTIPVKRINQQKWCSETGGLHLRLTGEGSNAFHLYNHHKHGHILMKTARILDREIKSVYTLRLCVCCQSCLTAESPAAEVVSIKVDVLDTNDHQPAFNESRTKIVLADSTALRSKVYQVTASDSDTGKNAELFYFTLPKNGLFYVVPKTGEVILVDSILGRLTPIKFNIYARDHGHPILTSQKLEVEIWPRQLPAPDLKGSGKGLLRKRKSLLQSENPVVVTVSEDASIGSVVMSLNPVRFQAASFEMVYPTADSVPVTVGRDSGDIVISRRLDRETQSVVEITVKIQDKRGTNMHLAIFTCSKDKQPLRPTPLYVIVTPLEVPILVCIK
ncbi:FAT protein, partial [Polypterus senegalus]